MARPLPSPVDDPGDLEVRIVPAGRGHPREHLAERHPAPVAQILEQPA